MTQKISLILQESNEKEMVKFMSANFNIFSYLFIATSCKHKPGDKFNSPIYDETSNK